MPVSQERSDVKRQHHPQQHDWLMLADEANMYWFKRVEAKKRWHQRKMLFGISYRIYFSLRQSISTSLRREFTRLVSDIVIWEKIKCHSLRFPGSRSVSVSWGTDTLSSADKRCICIYFPLKNQIFEYASPNIISGVRETTTQIGLRSMIVRRGIPLQDMLQKQQSDCVFFLYFSIF